MQISEKDIENLLVNIVLENKKLKKDINPKRHNFMPLKTWEWAKQMLV